MNLTREEVQLKPINDAIVRSSPENAIGGGNDISEGIFKISKKILIEGIMDIIRPSITKLDDQVKNTRKSQLLLAGDITKLSECKCFQKFKLTIVSIFYRLETNQRRTANAI